MAARYALAIALGTVVLLLRQPGMSALDTIWAEDGRIFLADALERPFRDVVLAPYRGYALVVPRLLAEVASHLPLELAAATLSGGSALIVSMLAAFVYRATAFLDNGVLRLAHASAIILLPVTIRESLNNVSGLHWFLMFAAFWGLAWMPRSWPLRILATIVVALSGLTDPLTLLLAPLVALRLFAARRLMDHVVTLGWAAGLAVQLTVAIGGLPGPATSSPTPVDLVAAYGARVVAVNALGLDLSQRLWPVLGGALTFIGVGVALLVVTMTAIRPRLPARALVGAALVIGMAMFVVTHVIRWTDTLGAAETWTRHLDGSRYLIVPSLLLASVVAMLVASRGATRIPSPWRRRLGVLVLLWGVVVAATSFSLPNGRQYGPSWRAALDVGRRSCAEADAPSVEIPITPAGWDVEIACDRVGG